MKKQTFKKKLFGRLGLSAALACVSLALGAEAMAQASAREAWSGASGKECWRSPSGPALGFNECLRIAWASELWLLPEPSAQAPEPLSYRLTSQ